MQFVCQEEQRTLYHVRDFFLYQIKNVKLHNRRVLISPNQTSLLSCLTSMTSAPSFTIRLFPTITQATVFEMQA